ncbi:MAG: ATP-binding cassette domain-containing protein [Microscillaceae bacterium]|nr:ATP-binding cassette domain-containing protein [Microscillaceae bacterium]
MLQIPAWHSNQGEHWLLLGNSGSGKTTLLHSLGGLLSIQSGTVIVAERDWKSMKGSQRDRFRARHIGLIFQKAHLIHTLNVFKNLILAQYLAGIKPDPKRCEEVLDHLNMLSHRNAYPRQLSEGEKQRVSVARAVLNSPSVLLADEPTASLDDENARQVILLLKEQANLHQATLLIATHDQRIKEHFDKKFLL